MRILALSGLLLAGCGEDDMFHITGQAVDSAGAPFEDVVTEVVAYEVYFGTVGNDEGYSDIATSDDGSIDFEVPPGRYVVTASAGTCNGLVETLGAAGDEVELQIVVTCNE